MYPDVGVCGLYMYTQSSTTVDCRHPIKPFRAIGNRDSILGSTHKPAWLFSTLINAFRSQTWHSQMRQGPTSPRPANA